MAKRSTDPTAHVVAEAAPEVVTVTCPECGAQVELAAASTECNSCGCRVYRP